MENVCRICLENTSTGVNILSNVNNSDKTISNLIMECAAIKINEDDCLPKQLCSNCYIQLLKLSQFRELIIQSDAQLNKKCIKTGVNSTHTDQVDLNQETENCDDFLQQQPEIFIKEESMNNSPKYNKKIIDDMGINDLSVLKNMSLKSGRKTSDSKQKRKVHEFKCTLCEKILYGRSNRLKEHILMAHSDIKNHCCEICHKKFKSKQQLVNHKRVHTGEKPYQCHYCSERFASPQNLFNHKKKHTGDYKCYKCHDCNKGYPTPGELESHIRICHTGEKPFLCEICSKAYSSKRNLGFHIRCVHEKNEKCEKCGLMLSRKRMKEHLQKHKDREEGVRRFTCDKCGKGFFSSHALKRHTLIHTGEKPHFCQICKKPFTQKSAVDTHMRVHSDIRSFSCQFCPKTFKYKQHLQLHSKKKHGDPPNHL
ncbi:uncharacterized protein LOC143198875 [Rhynchophorus ferrugineus]|uniref:uncharacterized protein LOC143198875 n=1 Tax=Rhynchophorus ferrugineus TaxID=354439 RepID=UPI003FCCB3E8